MHYAKLLPTFCILEMSSISRRELVSNSEALVEAFDAVQGHLSVEAGFRCRVIRSLTPWTCQLSPSRLRIRIHGSLERWGWNYLGIMLRLYYVGLCFTSFSNRYVYYGNNLGKELLKWWTQTCWLTNTFLLEIIKFRGEQIYSFNGCQNAENSSGLKFPTHFHHI